MIHHWRALTFLHYSCAPAEIQRQLPDGLTVDTFPDSSGNERAWVGLVPFRMENVRPVAMPGLPGCTAFAETNVRTYVHRDGRDPGVWFFSLDAANFAACRWARLFYGLPYFEAVMAVREGGSTVSYRSRRLRAMAPAVNLTCELGEELPAATPGTLEFFLVERYLLYALRRGRLHTGQVHHPPYPLRAATVQEGTESLVQAAHLTPRSWEHVLYSPGVDVEVFRLQRAL